MISFPAKFSSIVPRGHSYSGAGAQYRCRFRSACNMSSFIRPANREDSSFSASSAYFAIRLCTENSAHGFVMRSICVKATKNASVSTADGFSDAYSAAEKLNGGLRPSP